MLEQQTDFNFPPKHRKRFARQKKGEVVYLIAWYENLPIGHVLLKWSGTTKAPMVARLKDCPHIEDLFVIPDCRSKGIGSQLMDAVEGLCAQKGYAQVGLGVGIDNLRARSLYERRGYIDAGFGEFRTIYPYLDKNGKQQSGEEICVYLVKKLL